MIIYELIYYYEDVASGAEITETSLILNFQEVAKKIEAFKYENGVNNGMTLDTGVLEEYIGEYYRYTDSNDNSSNLEVRKHNI